MILVNGKEFEFKKFPNGETLMNHKQLEEGWKIQRVSFKYEDDSDLIKLKFLKDYLDSVNRKVEKLVIYYMPYSRMDRSEGGSPFTLKYVANFINSLKFDCIEVIEPHSDVTCALLDKANANYVNFKLLSMVMEEVGFINKLDYLVFPDAGAQKRYSKILNPNILVGNKKRDFGTGEILGLDIIGNINKYGKKAIIVDDLSSYGTTFVNTSQALKEKGIEQVYLLVAHAEDSVLKPHPVTGVKLLDHIDKLFTTNTILSGNWSDNWYQAKFKDKIKVYNIEELLLND